jgi:hypothetical protein
VRRPLHIEVSDLARAQIRAAEAARNSNAPRCSFPSSLKSALAPETFPSQAFVVFTSRAFAITFYYRVVADPERIEILAFWHESRGSGPSL